MITLKKKDKVTCVCVCVFCFFATALKDTFNTWQKLQFEKISQSFKISIRMPMTL